MKIGQLTISAASVALLAIQLLLVSAVAGRYLWQRWRCPRVWTPAQVYSPEMDGGRRYVPAQLIVDGCQSTLPSAKAAQFPRGVNGAVVPGPYVMRPAAVSFRANLKVENNKLVAVEVEGDESGRMGEEVSAAPGVACDRMQLERAVDFYIAGPSREVFPLKPNQQLWAEVTVPRNGAPRPLQLAVKGNGRWKPLD